VNTRILPRDEWALLDGTDIAKALPYHNPEDVQVVVVERESQIVGAWAVLRVVQLEGVWIAPEYRKKGSVAKRLLDRTMAVARSLAPHFVFTGAQDAEVAHLLTKHLNAVKLPMDSYVIPLRPLGEVSCL
jgi:hypothetical protein